MAQNDGLCMYDNATQQLERITRTDGKLYQPQVGRSFIDSENNLWLFNEPNDIERLSSCNQTINHRADGSATRFLYRDNRQRIWRSTDNDRLMIYDIHGKLSGYVSTNGSISRTLASFPTVYSMAETKNGFVWIGTKNKGLYCFMPKDNGGFDVRHYHSEGGKHSYLPADDIFSLATDHEGRLWVGTYSQGLFLLENPPVPYATFRKVQGFPSDFRSNNIRALLCLHNGLMAVGTSNGLITFATDPRNPSVVKAFHNRRGNNKPNSLCNNVIMSLFEDSRKRLYIVSPTSGICHTASANLLSDSIPFTTIATRNGAPSDMPLAISEDKQNRLWIAYTNSISCLQKDRKAFGNRPFPCDNENSLLSASSIVTLANDTMMTGTNNGIALWDISTRSKTAMPRIAVTELSVCGSPRNTDFDFTDTLKLSSAERDITMTISALLPSGNKYVRYASRADITSRWTIHGNNAQLSLMNLNAGWHRLQIKSTDNTGAWTDNVRTLHIHVQPTFWETPWATLMYILLLALVIGTAAGVWAYIYHLRVKLRTRMENIKMRVDFINNVAPELQKAEDNILECVRLYVNSRIDDEKLSVPEIAGHVGMSVAAFRARFKQLTGVSPVDYLRHYRIECAKNLLLTTNMTVSEVAYRCGFSDPKYFSRVFKAVEGVSPSAFKDNTH